MRFACWTRRGTRLGYRERRFLFCVVWKYFGFGLVAERDGVHHRRRHLQVIIFLMITWRRRRRCEGKIFSTWKVIEYLPFRRGGGESDGAEGVNSWNRRKPEAAGNSAGHRLRRQDVSNAGNNRLRVSPNVPVFYHFTNRTLKSYGSVRAGWKKNASYPFVNHCTDHGKKKRQNTSFSHDS